MKNVGLILLLIILTSCSEPNKFESEFSKPEWFDSVNAPDVHTSVQVAELTQSIKTPPIELLPFMIKLIETEGYYANYAVLASIARYKDKALRYRENLKAIKVSLESGKVKIQHKEYTAGVLDFILGEEPEDKQ
jgi:hypothetical protein